MHFESRSAEPENTNTATCIKHRFRDMKSHMSTLLLIDYADNRAIKLCPKQGKNRSSLCFISGVNGMPEKSELQVSILKYQMPSQNEEKLM